MRPAGRRYRSIAARPALSRCAAARHAALDAGRAASSADAYRVTACVCGLRTEAARVQEDSAGAHLPDLVCDSAQLRRAVGDVADVLCRVQGPAVGPGAAGTALYGMRNDDSREMQGSRQRRLHTTSVFIRATLC